MKKYGVIGFPVQSSFSPAFFAKKFKKEGIVDCDYQAYELRTAKNLITLLKDNNLKGVNVTMPLKQEVIPYLDSISDAAVKINAVNTISICNGKLCGDNTDHWGFRKSIVPLLCSEHSRALIFGSGGASLAVKYVLSQIGIPYSVVSRNGDFGFSYGELTSAIIAQHTLLINCTPLGMLHNVTEAVPIPYEGIGVDHLCYDLIYNPTQTAFMTRSKEQGAVVKNGLEMLEIQANKSWNIWNM